MDALHRLTPAPRSGDRLVVRYRLGDGSATDALGWVVGLDEDTIELHDHHGFPTVISRASVLAARRLPAARGGRDPMRTAPIELQQIALHGWLDDSEPLGDWTLRAAGGFTARANSCLAVGDPGVGVAEAAERITSYATRRGARPWAQVVAGSLPEDELRRLGWRDVHLATDMLATRLADLLSDSPPHPRVSVAEVLSPGWEAAYQASRPNSADQAVVRRILENGAPRAFAGVVGSADSPEVIAIGRGHLRDDWLGVAAVWTSPEHGRQGWATAILLGLGHWAARRGARNVYLQVAADNQRARRAYERLGFRLHHAYRYLGAPGD